MTSPSCSRLIELVIIFIWLVDLLVGVCVPLDRSYPVFNKKLILGVRVDDTTFMHRYICFESFQSGKLTIFTQLYAT